MNSIVLITSNIAPYRLKWCEELANFFRVTIYYTKDKEINYNDSFLKHKSEKCKIEKLRNTKDDGKDYLCLDVIRVIKESKESLIIFDGYGPKTNLLGLFYCKLKRIDSIINVDGYPTDRKNSKIINIVRRFVISKLGNYFFCGGENVKKYLISFGAEKEKIVVHNFSSISNNEILDKPLTKEEKYSVRRELNINTDKDIVLGVGRFVPLKRFEDLIRAIKRCKSDCELYILGGKPTKEYISLVDDAKNIHFLDFVLPEDVYKYYEMSNLFVLPSETDVWGLVINEAMAKGLPVISSDSPVAATNLVKENGMIYKTYDVDELAKDIDYCLESDNNKKMSINSLKIINEYTIEKMVELQLPFINKYFNRCK